MSRHIGFGLVVIGLSVAACGSSSSTGTTSSSGTGAAAAGTGTGTGAAAASTGTGGSAAAGSGTGTAGQANGTTGTSTGAPVPAMVSTLAGSGLNGGVCGAAGGDSAFSPLLLVVDSAANVFVTSDALDMINAAGNVTDLGAFPSIPNGLAAAAAGTAYYSVTANFTNDTTIMQVTGSTSTTFFAETGTSCGDTGSGGSDGGAGLGEVMGLAADSAGNVYVADQGCFAVRKIAPGGTVSTLAGSGSPGEKNGQGTSASFSSLSGITIDPSGNLYVADGPYVRKILPDGTVSTYATGLQYVGGIAVDGNGNVYFSDYTANIVREITGAKITTLAGVMGTPGYMDGPAAMAEFNSPQGVGVDSMGNVYVADNGNCYVRKIVH